MHKLNLICVCTTKRPASHKHPIRLRQVSKERLPYKTLHDNTDTGLLIDIQDFFLAILRYGRHNTGYFVTLCQYRYYSCGNLQSQMSYKPKQGSHSKRLQNFGYLRLKANLQREFKIKFH